MHRLAHHTWEYVVAEQPSVATAQRLGAACKWLRQQAGVSDAWAGLVSLAVVCEGDAPTVEALVHASFSQAEGHTASKHYECRCRYDGDDLAAVAEACALDTAAVVERHAGVHYTVGAVGFLPGFPYLLGLDPALTLPRRATPRTRIQPGRVAIADGLCGIYPRISPGGWHLIGSLCDPIPDCDVGDTVTFIIA